MHFKYIKLSGTLIMYQTIFFQVMQCQAFVCSYTEKVLLSYITVNTVVILRPMELRLLFPSLDRADPNTRECCKS